MKKILYYLIQFTWGLPQNIVGFFLTLKYRKNKKENFFNSLITYHYDNWGGISLGMFILINGNRDKEWIDTTKVHEFGHSIQSLILGPLFLFVIGIPSIVWCNSKKYTKLRKESNVSYFDFYPEKWANYLGSKVTHLAAPNK
jgi:hypothetical protein